MGRCREIARAEVKTPISCRASGNGRKLTPMAKPVKNNCFLARFRPKMPLGHLHRQRMLLRKKVIFEKRAPSEVGILRALTVIFLRITFRREHK